MLKAYNMISIKEWIKNLKSGKKPKRLHIMCRIENETATLMPY